MLTLARREPSALLFGTQLLGVVLYPFMEGSAGRALISAFGIAILGLVVLAVRSAPGLTWIGVLLPYSSALEAILYFYAAGGLIAYMLADHVITCRAPA